MVDVVTSSHNHTDHLDHETLWPLLAANPALSLVIPEANRAFVAERLRTDPAWPLGLVHGESLDVGRVPDHRPRRRPRGTRHRRARPPPPSRLPRRCRAVPLVPLRRRRAVRGDGRRTAPAQPAGSHSTWRCCRSTAGSPSAVCPETSGATRRRRLPTVVGARLVVPMHYEMFAFNTETPDLFVTTAEQLGQPYRVLQCGELLEITKGSPRP